MEFVDARKALRIFVGQHPTQKAAAKALRITPQYLHDLLYGRRAINDGMLSKLGLKQVVVQK